VNVLGQIIVGHTDVPDSNAEAQHLEEK